MEIHLTGVKQFARATIRDRNRARDGAIGPLKTEIQSLIRVGWMAQMGSFTRPRRLAGKLFAGSLTDGLFGYDPRSVDKCKLSIWTSNMAAVNLVGVV